MPRTCPECHRSYSDDVKLCPPCGIDLLTGRHLSTRIATPMIASRDEEAGPKPWWYFLAYIPAMFPGLKKPVVWVVSFLFTVVALVLMGLGLGLALAGAVLGGGMVCGMGLLAYAQALAWMIVGEMKMLPELLMDFDSVRWGCFFLILILTFFGLVTLMKAAAAAI